MPTPPLPDRVPYRATDRDTDTGEDTTTAIDGERKRKRIWRALIWGVFANVLLFWLITCASAQTTNWTAVYMSYSPDTGNDNYTLTPVNVAGTRNEGVKFGTWLPTISVDQYAATMANRFGVTGAELNAVFPNLSKFPTPNLGFMV